MNNSINHSFYWFSDNTIYQDQFTWAYGIRNIAEEIINVCPECGHRSRYINGSFDVVVEDGTQYPDVLGCGAYPLLIVSEAVVNDWKEVGITSFHTSPVGIVDVQSPELKDVTPPAYFHVEIDGRCQIDMEGSGLKVINYCPKCHNFSTEPSTPNGFKMLPDTWDGSPIFRDIERKPAFAFCTHQILELARKHKRTNFRFEPMQGPWVMGGGGINYLKE